MKFCKLAVLPSSRDWSLYFFVVVVVVVVVLYIRGDSLD
jgi:hypothetical protein